MIGDWSKELTPQERQALTDAWADWQEWHGVSERYGWDPAYEIHREQYAELSTALRRLSVALDKLELDRDPMRTTLSHLLAAWQGELFVRHELVNKNVLRERLSTLTEWLPALISTLDGERWKGRPTDSQAALVWVAACARQWIKHVGRPGHSKSHESRFDRALLLFSQHVKDSPPVKPSTLDTAHRQGIY